MWSFKQKDLLKEFRESADHLGIGFLAKTLYVTRHGGASRDILERYRSMEAVQRRGRWAHLNSVKHYDKHGRLQLLVSKIPANVVAQAKQQRKAFRRVFLS